MKKYRKALTGAVVAVACLAVAPMASYAAETEHFSEWVTDEKGRIFYYDEEGNAVTGEQEIDGEIYLFSKNGVQKTGWRTVNGVRRYYDVKTGKQQLGSVEYCGSEYFIDEENGKVAKCTILDKNDDIVAFDNKGCMIKEDGFFDVYENGEFFYVLDGKVVTGEQEIDGVPYVFDSHGACKTGWVDVSDGRRFYYDSETLEQKNGFFNSDGNIYYIDREKGMIKGDINVNGVDYLFNEKGEMQFGLLEINEKVYYFNEDGTFAKGLTEVGGNSYIFGENGAMVSGLQELDGKLYYSGEDGRLLRGKVEAGEECYYFGDDFSAQSGMYTVDGQSYIFGEDFKMMKGLTEFNGKKYCLDDDGKMLTGRLAIGGNKYYFAEDGTMQFGWVGLDDGKYYFDDNGIMHSGWLTDGEEKYYFGENGYAVSGICEIEGKKYFFDSENVMRSGRLAIGGNKYYFGEDGAMQFGWVELEDGKYYFDNNGVMVVNKKIDGYNLTETGKAVPFSAVQNKAQEIINSIGTSRSAIYYYVRNHNVYSYIEGTRSLAQIEATGWSYFADYALRNRYVVCYYFAAVTDLLFQQAGYTSRIVYGNGTHTSDHYWNQVLVDGVWLNYDTCNGFEACSWSYLESRTYHIYDYVTPKFY